MIIVDALLYVAHHMAEGGTLYTKGHHRAGPYWAATGVLSCVCKLNVSISNPLELDEELGVALGSVVDDKLAVLLEEGARVGGRGWGEDRVGPRVLAELAPELRMALRAGWTAQVVHLLQDDGGGADHGADQEHEARTVPVGHAVLVRLGGVLGQVHPHAKQPAEAAHPLVKARARDALDNVGLGAVEEKGLVGGRVLRELPLLPRPPRLDVGPCVPLGARGEVGHHGLALGDVALPKERVLDARDADDAVPLVGEAEVVAALPDELGLA